MAESAVHFEEVHERIYRLPTPFEGGGIVNLYLLRGAKTAIVDSGVLGTPTNFVAPALEPLGLTLDDIDFVLNTHGHMDHLGGNGELKDAGAAIYLHREDVPRANSNRVHIDSMAANLRLLGLEERVPGNEAFLLRLLGREAGVDRMLAEGDVVDLGAGLRLQVVSTPGHTPGSVCYWWESEGILITGDSVQGRGGRPGGLPVIEDGATYGQSQKRLLGIGASRLFGAHAFRGAHGILGPVAEGPKVSELIQESLFVHESLEREFRAAAGAEPGGTPVAVARRALGALRETIGLENDPSGYPPGAAYTVPAYLRAATKSGGA